MRKKLLVLSMFIVAILPMLLIPTVLPKPRLKCPTYVEGLWEYMPQILDTRVCDNDVVLRTEEEGWFTGSFEGTSYDYPCTVVVHDAVFDDGGNIVGWGSRYYTGKVYYKETVNGKRGRLKMYVVGKQVMGEDGPEDWQGTWRIVIGWGKLRRVQGFGTWWGPGFIGEGKGQIYYDGWVF